MPPCIKTYDVTDFLTRPLPVLLHNNGYSLESRPPSVSSMEIRHLAKKMAYLHTSDSDFALFFAFCCAVQAITRGIKY